MNKNNRSVSKELLKAISLMNKKLTKTDKCLDENTKQSESLIKHTIGIKRLTWTLLIFTAILLLVSAVLFLLEKHQRDTENLQGHIANIKSLELEMRKNIEGINLILLELNESKLIYVELIVENLKNRIPDGRIINTTIKERIIVRYADIIQFNNVIKVINSPDFALIDDINYFERKASMEKRTIEVAKEIKMRIEDDLPFLEQYIHCLEKKQKIHKC